MVEPATIDLQELDTAYAFMMRSIVESGQAPHFTDLARALNASPERGRVVLHELCAVTPGWMHPETDWLASFPPFNVQPTQYHITIDNKHGWYGQ